MGSYVFFFLPFFFLVQIPMSDVSEEERSKEGAGPQCGLKRSAPSGRSEEEEDDENADSVGSFEDVFGSYVRSSGLLISFYCVDSAVTVVVIHLNVMNRFGAMHTESETAQEILCGGCG